MNWKLFTRPSVFLIFIVLIAAILRFYQLGINPPSLTWDEVAWGYNAYAVGIDGKDEFGHFLPYTSFISFGDYKPPMYAYLDVIPVWIFGLTELTTRFPSAFFGTLTVLFTYFLVKELFADHEKKSNGKLNVTEIVALVSALFLAISPWHIMLSRAAFEANVASFFIVTGVWLFLLAIRKNQWLLVLSAICFVLCIYTFNSTRVVAPLLLFSLAVGNIKRLWKIKSATITACIVGLALLLPVVPFLLSPQARLRYQEVNIFSNVDIIKTANQEVINDNNAKWSKIIHNRRVVYTLDFLQHYFDNFNPNFLFITGDQNPKFSTQDVGQMYIWDLPFLLMGTLFLFRKRVGKWWIIPIWLAIGIIPAAISLPTPHALRIEATIPTLQILTAYGFVTFILALKKYQKQTMYALLIMLFLFVGYYLHGYYTYYPTEFSAEWQYGYQNAIKFVKAHQQEYDAVDISGMDRAYIYTLFYLQYPPQEFRQTAQVSTDVFGFVHVYGFGKYHFVDSPPAFPSKEKTLYISGVSQVPKKAHVLETFRVLDGTPELVAFTR